MEDDIPKIYFKRDQSLGIEVMNFKQLLKKLEQSKDHDPFSVHRVEFFVILIVTKNSYSHFVDFKLHQLEQGSALFIAKNQIHHFTESLHSSEGFCIVFNSQFIRKDYFWATNLKLNRLFNYHIETPVIHQEQLGEDDLMKQAVNLYDEYTFFKVFAKTEILHALLHVLLLKAERAKELEAIKGIKVHWLERFNQFKDLLESDYAKTRNSKDYAAKLLISYKYLNDIVKHLSGKTAKSFIDDFVTMEIKRYLVSTSLSVKEISYKIGFEEPANMVKFFKKNAGATPLKFRMQF